MAYDRRFIRSTLWKRPFFGELSLKDRLFWIYLWSQADISGVHQLHYPVDSAYLGFDIDREFIKDFLGKVNSDEERIRPLKGQRLWIISFVRFQQKPKGGPLSDSAPPHVNAVRTLKEHGILKQAIKNDPDLFENHVNIDEYEDSLYEGNSKGNTRVGQGYNKGDNNNPNKGNNPNPNTGNKSEQKSEGDKKDYHRSEAEKNKKIVDEYKRDTGVSEDPDLPF